MPQRVQLRRTKGWRMPENTVKVDRSTGWGNPFPISRATSRHGGKESYVWVVGTWSGPAMWILDTRDEAVNVAVTAYRSWAVVQPELVQRATAELVGKNLACWCPLDQPCHADVLLELANPGERA